MPDIASISGVLIADIASIGGVLIADIASVGGATAAADTTPPDMPEIINVYPGNDNVNGYTNLSEATGMYHWIISLSSGMPSAEDVKNGVGAVENCWHSDTVLGTNQYWSLGGSYLTADTTYYIYCVHEDIAHNLSLVGDDTFTTSVAP